MAVNDAVRWQKPMQGVLYASAPLAVAGIYFFGWRVAVMLAVSCLVGFLAERPFTRGWNEPVSSAVFVTAMLFTLSLPPTLPLWMVAVGMAFAVVFGKMVFGGFGRNVFNPALTGRAFIYVCFGQHMTAVWGQPIAGSAGGFLGYQPDAITTATPGMLLKTGVLFPLADEFFGRAAGTIGGTSALLALIGGAYLLWTRTASYRIVVATFAGYLAIQTLLWLGGVKGAVEPIHAMLGGSFVVGAFFYATDPVSASQTDPGRWVYGAAIGVLSSLISVFSVWPAGTMFAILLANMFAPLLDYGVKGLRGPAPAGGAS
jgi:Na+-transporting NADH:ubiquinone oxidoreductase subunit B